MRTTVTIEAICDKAKKLKCVYWRIYSLDKKTIYGQNTETSLSGSNDELREELKSYSGDDVLVRMYDGEILSNAAGESKTKIICECVCKISNIETRANNNFGSIAEILNLQNKLFEERLNRQQAAWEHQREIEKLKDLIDARENNADDIFSKIEKLINNEKIGPFIAGIFNTNQNNNNFMPAEQISGPEASQIVKNFITLLQQIDAKEYIATIKKLTDKIQSNPQNYFTIKGML